MTKRVAHLDLLQSVLGSDHASAGLLGVSRSQVSRWRRGQVPDLLNADRLGGLALLVEMAAAWFEPELVGEWLESANAHLAGRTPAFMLRSDRIADVIGALEAEKRGVFA